MKKKRQKRKEGAKKMVRADVFKVARFALSNLANASRRLGRNS
jgi:hypothetical protein